MKRSNTRNGAAIIKTVIGAVLCVLFGFLLICNLIIIAKGTMNPEKPVDVYQSSMPKAGDFAMFLQQPLGMLFFIGILLLSLYCKKFNCFFCCFRSNRCNDGKIQFVNSEIQKMIKPLKGYV